mgnify:CR=1 FL=1
MRKRLELGVSPFPTGAASDLPASTHEAYEDAIRDAARFVGHELLKLSDVRKAWFYFNMLGEPEPVRKFLEEKQPGPDEDVQPLIEIGLYHGAHPTRGFGLIVERYGICNAITTFSGQDFTKNPLAKQECIGLLVRALHAQLLERLHVDLEAKKIAVPKNATILEIVTKHPELFEEGAYHLDTSHLASITQFSLEVEDPAVRKLARELCEYGKRLSTTLNYPGDPPFENTYADYLVLLTLLDGEQVEEGLQHFRAKVEPEAAQGNTFPAEVYVNILLKLNRPAEALAAAKQYLANETRPLSCPSVYELCQRANDFAGLASVAQQRGDGVSFLASLIADKK